MVKMKRVFVGIDVAFAKRKRLPVCVCVNESGKLTPLPLAKVFEKPPAGAGNKAIVEGEAIEEFSTDTARWLKKMESRLGLRIVRIALDCPSSFCGEQQVRREAELALDAAGISCFATPSRSQFQTKLQRCREHLVTGGAVNRLPNANQLWMLVGFSLFKSLSDAGYDCIETYPQAFVREMGWAGVHKSMRKGLLYQISRVAEFQGFELGEFDSILKSMGFGSTHDRLDAYLSAWVASLKPSEEKRFGGSPDDSIVVLKA